MLKLFSGDVDNSSIYPLDHYPSIYLSIFYFFFYLTIYVYSDIYFPFYHYIIFLLWVEENDEMGKEKKARGGGRRKRGGKGKRERRGTIITKSDN